MLIAPRNLKPYILSLCRVHASHGSFAVPETREIGREIYRKYGRDGMVAVCDAVYDEMGEDLEYEWLCIPWQVMLPRLREMLDRRGLRHITIVNFDDDPHLTPEQLNERFVMC